MNKPQTLNFSFVHLPNENQISVWGMGSSVRVTRIVKDKRQNTKVVTIIKITLKY